MLELKAGQRHLIIMTLDGQEVRGLTEPRMLLSDFLRQELGRPEVHVGCEHGVCGACTVLLDGKPTRSCLTFAVQAAGRRVDTVRSLAHEDQKLSDLQNAFRKHHGLQCGYCTPGILLSAEAFLTENPKPSEQEVREMLSGHICRCTGYVGIVDAILETAQKRASAAAP
ncbi:MAG: (2Fe-2S)-binding protein [Xanthobacteraceae bacterium]|jgi:2-furoyl-CoA dehydrogenase 2Fe-2S iron sulfur subunit